MQPVTAVEAAEILDIGAETIRYWRDRDILKPVSVSQKYGLAKLYDLEDIRKLVEHRNLGRANMVPPGYMALKDAAARLGLVRSTVYYNVKTGKLRGMQVKYFQKKLIWFVLAADVEAKLTGQMEPVPAPEANVEPEKEIIAARDSICLPARREMFERAGRQLNLKNALARSRKAV